MLRIWSALVTGPALLAALLGCTPPPPLGQWSADSERFLYLSPDGSGIVERGAAGEWQVSRPKELRGPIWNGFAQQDGGNGSAGLAVDSRLERLAMVLTDEKRSEICIAIGRLGEPPPEPVAHAVPKEVQLQSLRKHPAPLLVYWSPDDKRLLISAARLDEPTQPEGLASFSYDLETKKLTTYLGIVACPLSDGRSHPAWPWLGSPIRPDSAGFLGLRLQAGHHASLMFVEFGGQGRELAAKTAMHLNLAGLFTAALQPIGDARLMNSDEAFGSLLVRWEGPVATITLPNTRLRLDTERLRLTAEKYAPIDRGPVPLLRYSFPASKVVVKATAERLGDMKPESPEADRRELVIADPEAGELKLVARGNRDCRFAFYAAPNGKWGVAFVHQRLSKLSDGTVARRETLTGILLNAQGEVVKEWNALKAE